MNPIHDVVMAFLWVPFAVAAHLVATDPERLPWLVSATLLFSFAHQPLTLWLAYGDAAQRRAHSTLLLWAPLVAAAAAWLGPLLQPEGVAIVAGVWNVWHTLRQRYGIARLYGRLEGIDCGSDNRLLWSWLSLALLIAAAGSQSSDLAGEMGLGARNASAVDALATVAALSEMLLPIAIVICVAVSVSSLRDEWRRDRHSLARLLYLGATAALLVVVAAAPVVGFVAYVGAHAAEYFLMVRWRVSRAAQRGTDGDSVGAVARRIGGAGTIGTYAAAVIILIVGVRTLDGSEVAGAIVLTFGALHLLYDGMIWRSPKQVSHPPAVQPSVVSGGAVSV